MDAVLFYQYIVIGILVYSGLIVGKLMSLISPEEIRPGERYLIFLQRAFLLAILVVFAFSVKVIAMKMVVIIVLAYSLYVMNRNTFYRNNNYYPIYNVVAVFLGFTPFSLIMLPASLGFLLGIPTMVLNHNKKLNLYLKLFLVFFVFYTASFIIYNNMLS